MDLEYDVSYHLRCQITLQSGRTITMEALDQERSYAGLEEGIPDAKANDWYIASSLREAERRCVAGARPHLIPPARRDFLREPGDMRWVVERSPHRVPEWLPMVRCIGSFRGGVKARDPAGDFSFLVVVWFQDEYALPILDPALGQLLSLDWDSLAADLDY